MVFWGFFLDNGTYCTLNRLQYCVNITTICTGKPNIHVICFTAVVWNQTTVWDTPVLMWCKSYKAITLCKTNLQLWLRDPSAPSTWPPSQTSPKRFSMEEWESLAAFLLGILDQPWCRHCSCRKLLLQSSGLLACDWAEDLGWEDNACPSQPSACPILSPEAKLWSYFSSLAKYPSFLRIKRHHKLASAQHIPWAQLYVFIQKVARGEIKLHFKG